MAEEIQNQEQQVEQKPQESAPPVESPPAGEPKKKCKCKWLLVIGLLALIGAGVYYFLVVNPLNLGHVDPGMDQTGMQNFETDEAMVETQETTTTTDDSNKEPDVVVEELIDEIDSITESEIDTDFGEEVLGDLAE